MFDVEFVFKVDYVVDVGVMKCIDVLIIVVYGKDGVGCDIRFV